jgi:hypothetical protein
LLGHGPLDKPTHAQLVFNDQDFHGAPAGPIHTIGAASASLITLAELPRGAGRGWAAGQDE